MNGFADYEKYDGLGLAELVRKKEIAPAELLDCAVERIEARNPALNAVVNRAYDRARAACAALPEGPFAGVPFLLKDLLVSWAGAPRTASSRFLADHRSERDSELVARFQRAGVVILGQTNTPEFGVMPVTEPRLRGPARNPWNPEHTPGGSSGGAAAAVAAGMVPLAHGNDGGGSIRIPASCCGLFGLKPTRGRNPLGPDIGDTLGSFVQDHVLTRSVRDSAAMLDATRGSDPGAPYAAPPVERPFIEELARASGRLRIAFTTRSLFGQSTHPDCAAAVEDAAGLCQSLGHDVEDAVPKLDWAALRRAYLVIVAAEIAQVIAAVGRTVGRRPAAGDFEPQTWALAVIGRGLSAYDLAEAMETTSLAGRHMAAFLRGHDLFLAPTMAYPPVKIGAFALKPVERLQLLALRALPARLLIDKALAEIPKDIFEATGNTMLFNMTGQPAMSVPLRWNAAGLPIGVQFAGRFGEEAALFRLAAQLEQARPWFDKRPPPEPGV